MRIGNKLINRINVDNIKIEGRIENIINNYFILRNNNNDYQSFENQKSDNNTTTQNYIMNEGKVDTV